jgi:acetoin utilization protein AcuB
MVVRHWMTPNVVAIVKGASIQDALAKMRQHSIRHLPVIDEQHQLLGWVSDTDLRGALVPSMLEELTVADVMIHQPYTVPPEMRLEEVTRLILDKRISGLPVVEKGKLIGVITTVDILSAFITMMGVLTSSARLDIRMPAQSDVLDQVTRLIQNRKGEILSICHVPFTKDADRVYSIRISNCDVESLTQTLTDQGFDVVATS